MPPTISRTTGAGDPTGPISCRRSRRLLGRLDDEPLPAFGGVPARADRVRVAAGHLLRRLSAPPVDDLLAGRAPQAQPRQRRRRASLPAEFPDRAGRRRGGARRDRLVRRNAAHRQRRDRGPAPGVSLRDPDPPAARPREGSGAAARDRAEARPESRRLRIRSHARRRRRRRHGRVDRRRRRRSNRIRKPRAPQAQPRKEKPA